MCKLVLLCSILSSRSVIGGESLFQCVLQCVSQSRPVPPYWSAKCLVCTLGSVLFNMPFSYTLFTLTTIGGSAGFFFLVFFFMHPALQAWVQQSQWPERWNLKAVHLKSSICKFLHYFYIRLICFPTLWKRFIYYCKTIHLNVSCIFSSVFFCM